MVLKIKFNFAKLALAVKHLEPGNYAWYSLVRLSGGHRQSWLFPANFGPILDYLSLNHGPGAAAERDVTISSVTAQDYGEVSPCWW